MIKGINRRKFIQTATAGTVAAVSGINLGYGQTPDQKYVLQSANRKGPIKYRLFWNWDYSTKWAFHHPGHITPGQANNYYARTEHAFLRDMENMFKWCGQNAIDAVMIWGLLRDAHGGVRGAQKACDIAHNYGVKILAGAGINAYGGVYYDSDHRYNLETYIEKYPDRSAERVYGQKDVVVRTGFKSSHRTWAHICPSRVENQKYMVESFQWLFNTVPVDGVQVETGDTGICVCDLCQKRRKYLHRSRATLNFEDMVLGYNVVTDAIRSVKKDAWIVCETYSQPQVIKDTDREYARIFFGMARLPEELALVKQFPEDVFVQWTGDRYALYNDPNWDIEWNASVSDNEKGHHNIMRMHWGSYWSAFGPFIWGLSDLFKKCISSGFDSMALFGEASPYQMPISTRLLSTEFDYRAFIDFGSQHNPTADIDVFTRDIAGPLLGSSELAKEYLDYLSLLNSKNSTLLDDKNYLNPDYVRSIVLPAIYKRLSALPPEIARRWSWLANALLLFYS